MNRAIKPILIIILTTVLILLTLGVVQARRAFKGGQETYYNLVACTDGLMGQLAYGFPESNQPQPNPATLTGLSLRDNTSILDIAVPLDEGPVNLTDSNGHPQPLDFSGSINALWTASLLPGSRVALTLGMDVPNTNVDINNPFYVTVQECTLSNPPADRDAIITQGLNNIDIPGANPNTAFCAPDDVVSTTITLTAEDGPLTRPISDINVAMYLNTPFLPVENLRARLTSPNDTTVQLFDAVGGGGSNFGSRRAAINGDLVGDPMADFVLDDSSVFGFSSAPTYCSTPDLDIPDDDPNGVTDEITLPDSGVLTDLDVDIFTTHTWVGDLIYTLEHVDTGTSVTIIDQPGDCNGNNISASIDDEATEFVEDECNQSSPAIAGRFIGGDPADSSLLAAFDGEDMAGTWSLNVSDNAGFDLGTFEQWCLIPTITPEDPTTVLAPFNKTAVQPDEPLSSFNGESAIGDWTLEICNRSPDESGELDAWYLEIEVDNCHALTFSHTGNGSQPTASLANSSGCSTSEYVPGESIDITAFPASDHHVSSWNGTTNDGSTSSTNMVSMPDGPHTVTANYVQDAPTCFALTHSHTGNGSDPTASPTNSTGCATGEYIAGESINVTAFPASGHHVGSWSGTNSNVSTANTNLVTMPANPHTVAVHYIQDAPTCFALTLSHTGNGNDPTALSTKSIGCTTGEYITGESINVTAFPASGHHVGSWNGTVNDASTANTNIVSMPDSPHAVTVNYVQDAPTCFALTLSHTGNGSDPTALPTNSTSCTTGKYIVGESINVSAIPAVDHHVDSWNGTTNDDSTANTNQVLMLASPHTVTVNYVQNSGSIVNLPVILSPVPPQWVTILSEDFEGSFPGSTWEVFDNDPNSGRYYWDKRDCRNNGGSFSAWSAGAGDSILGCGSNYREDMFAWMIYGPFSLNDAMAAELTFDWWSDTEPEWDGFFWGASIDGDSFYGTEITGNWSSWTTGELLDLSAAPNFGNLLGEDQIWIAFVFFSDFTVTDRGSFVDNVLLRKLVSPTTNRSERSEAPQHILQPDQTLEFSTARLNR